jgi:O-antigen/teichoic acid export membrane protein
LVRPQLGYAAPFALYVLVDLAYWNYHQYAVSYFFDAAAFAIYSVGCLQIPFVEFIATPAANVMMVRMGEEAREGRTNHLQWIWSDTTRRLALMFFPIVGLLVINARPLITLMFTENYAASVPIFMVWSLSILAAAFPTDSVLRVFAETRFLLFINIVRLTLTAATIYWFISRFHLIGPVIVTLIGLFVSKALALIRLTALMKIGLMRIVPWKSLGGILAVATLAALPAALVTSQLSLRPLYVLPLSGVVYISVYSGLIWGFDLVTMSERLAIATWLSRPARVLISRS